jgi:hypothetical protein
MTNRTRPRPAKGGSRPLPTTDRRALGRRIAPLVIAFALGALLAGPIAAFTTDDDAPAGGSSTADRIAALKAEEAKRDAAQIVELTTKARQVRERLLPVLAGLAAAVPPGQKAGAAAGAPPAAAEVEGWRTTTGAVVEEFANPPSGGTAVNIARSGLAAAVRQLDAAVDLYAAATALPPEARGTQVELAGRQRDIAIATWSSAATQLDVLNVDAGNGHAHVFLPAVPGQGALTADGAPEGK